MLVFPNKIREYLSKIGFITQYPYGTKAIGNIYIFVSMFILYQNANAIINHWNNISLRFLAIEHIFITTAITSILIEYALKPNYIHNLLSVSEGKYFQYDFINEEQKIIIDKTVSDINTKTNLIFLVVVIQVITMVTSPLIIFICKIYLADGKKFNELTIEDFPTPLAYGDPYNSIIIYLIIYIIQTVYLFFGIKFAYTIFISCIFAIQCVTLDEKLLSFAINSVNKKFEIPFRTDYNYTSVYSNNNGFQTNDYESDEEQCERELKMIMRQLIVHHQIIYR